MEIIFLENGKELFNSHEFYFKVEVLPRLHEKVVYKRITYTALSIFHDYDRNTIFVNLIKYSDNG